MFVAYLQNMDYFCERRLVEFSEQECSLYSASAYYEGINILQVNCAWLLVFDKK